MADVANLYPIKRKIYGKPYKSRLSRDIATILTHSLSTKAENIVKECAGITAVCHANSNDTKILNSIGETILSGINLWDLHEMIKEVF